MCAKFSNNFVFFHDLWKMPCVLGFQPFCAKINLSYGSLFPRTMWRTPKILMSLSAQWGNYDSEGKMTPRRSHSQREAETKNEQKVGCHRLGMHTQINIMFYIPSIYSAFFLSKLISTTSYPCWQPMTDSAILNSNLPVCHRICQLNLQGWTRLTFHPPVDLSSIGGKRDFWQCQRCPSLRSFGRVATQIACCLEPLFTKASNCFCMYSSKLLVYFQKDLATHLFLFYLAIQGCYKERDRYQIKRERDWIEKDNVRHEERSVHAPGVHHSQDEVRSKPGARGFILA